jgi:anaerobic selenocysteine-containing dehydrogenase
MRRRPGVPKGTVARGREQDVFEAISWDEALNSIATRLQQVSNEHGPESILPYSYAGTIGVLGYGSMDRRFFHRLGASQLDRTICATAGGEALLSVYGEKLGTDTEQFRHAKLVIAWGANVHGNNIHLWPMIEEARRHGARLVVIDPYRTRTAALADQHLAIHPGTDAALALGMMHVILREGLEDREYTAANTHGLRELRARVAEYTPACVAKWTGISADDIEVLARAYATTQPAVIRINYGVQRSENGGASARAIAMLPALTGAWKHLGGGLQLSTSGAFAWNSQALERPDLMYKSPLGRPARTINMSLLGDALTRVTDPPVHALFVYNSNPAVIAPDQSRVLAGLRRDDLFTVVHDQFLTDTADYADIVLPATTFLESQDIQGAYGHYYVQLSEQAIGPVGEARSNVWLFSQLAQRMGFAPAPGPDREGTDECFLDTEEQLMAEALWTGAPDQPPLFAGMTAETLRANGNRQRLRFPVEQAAENPQPFQPFVTGPFRTPSGKIEFYSESFAARGLDPMPAFVPPQESRHSQKTATNSLYPLEFLPRKADNYMNSTFANHPGHQKMEAGTANRLEMHAEDAAARGISSGDEVLVGNDRAEIVMTALVSERVRPGVVAARLAWNKCSPEGEGINQLTSQRLTDFGRGPTFYSTLVEVKARIPARK